MIVVYRVFGFLYLFGVGCSAVSLLAKIPSFQFPCLVVGGLLCLALGGYAVSIYYTRSTEDKDWIFSLGIILGILIFCIVGGVIQWG